MNQHPVGVRREQNNPYIRLVDAVCGLVRDALAGDTWAQEVLKGQFLTPL
jgi:hypothetical protein